MIYHFKEHKLITMKKFLTALELLLRILVSVSILSAFVSVLFMIWTQEIFWYCLFATSFLDFFLSAFLAAIGRELNNNY